MARIDRTKGIGGTDIGAIIGVNPWRGPMDVYLEKIGITEGQPDNEAMYWGREMEPVLLKRYVKEIGETGVFVPQPDDLPYVHPKYPWYLGSPDGIVVGNGGVDFKTTGRRESWGEPGTDQVPEYVACQCHWYMGLTGAEWWDVAVLFFAPRREFAIYRIPRNQELIDNLIEAGREFWEGHVIPQIPPPIDASEGSKKLLNYLYPRETEDLLEANETLEKWIKRLRNLEEARDNVVEDLTLTQNYIKEIIGDHAGVQTSLGKITWKKSKDRTLTDWMKAYFDLCEYCQEKGLSINDEDFSGKHTKIIPGSRIFRAWWNKREEV